MPGQRPRAAHPTADPRAALFDDPVSVRPVTTPLVLLAIDAEEDFDWRAPVPGTEHDTTCMRDLDPLQAIAGAHGIVPTYLLTYPVIADRAATDRLRALYADGRCGLGLQLHGWVTPPFDGFHDHVHSFTGTLPADAEAAKLDRLIDAFQAAFHTAPVVFRAGRYGLGPATARLLEARGFAVDVSVAPGTRFDDEGGPDYRAFDCAPFWFGERRRLLELPLCRDFAGWGGGPARHLYRTLDEPALRPWRAAGLLAASRAVERITLSPEGNDLAAMARLAGTLIDRGQRVLTVSFHSSSLRPGRNPYVRSAQDQARFMARLDGVLDLLTGPLGARPATLAALPALLAGEPQTSPPTRAISSRKSPLPIASTPSNG